MKDKEIWKPLIGFEGAIEISNCGRLRSVTRYVKVCSGGLRLVKSRILKTWIDGHGYECYTNSFDGKRKRLKVHRLVAQTFIPNPDGKPCIDHINTITTDNRVCNLRWVTKKENSNNPLSIAKARLKMSDSEAVAKNLDSRRLNHTKTAPKRVLQCINNRVLARYNSIREASLLTNINERNIAMVCLGKRKLAGGFVWKFLDNNIK